MPGRREVSGQVHVGALHPPPTIIATASTGTESAIVAIVAPVTAEPDSPTCSVLTGPTESAIDPARRDTSAETAKNEAISQPAVVSR